MKDGHMHLEYGPLTEEYVLQFVEHAKDMGLSEIQILDHTHRFIEFEPVYSDLREYEVQDTWLNNRKLKFRDHLSTYVELMERIKKMDLPVKVTYGLEVCYTPQAEEYIKSVLKDYHFDFLVGAIHSVDGILYDMPFSEELLWSKFDTDHIYRRYYDLVFSCVKSGIFTQLAHPDTIKLFNYYPSYDLKETYDALAELLKEYDMYGECNTGCNYRYHHKDVGLSDELLDVFKKHGVKIMPASDAHHPEDVGTLIKEVYERIEK